MAPAPIGEVQPSTKPVTSFSPKTCLELVDQLKPDQILRKAQYALDSDLLALLTRATRSGATSQPDSKQLLEELKSHFKTMSENAHKPTFNFETLTTGISREIDQTTERLHQANSEMEKLQEQIGAAQQLLREVTRTMSTAKTPNRTEYSPQPDETDSLYSEKDTSSILNVTTTPDPSCTGRTEKSFGASSTPNKTTSKSTDKCPCGKSDPQSTKVICAKCKRHWHNRCCNLSGLTQPMIKKLETWQCPKCYSCPILSQQPASLHAEFSALKQQINLLLESNSQKECCQSISAEVTALREQLSELVKVSKENEVKVKLSPDLEEAVRQVAQLSPELIAKIEESVTELKGQVSGIETAISNHSKAPSEKAVAPNT
ncbi:hypothetical protein ACHWQZ_G009240 [Mnemiopsis leidyi]